MIKLYMSINGFCNKYNVAINDVERILEEHGYNVSPNQMLTYYQMNLLIDSLNKGLMRILSKKKHNISSIHLKIKDYSFAITIDHETFYMDIQSKYPNIYRILKKNDKNKIKDMLNTLKITHQNIIVYTNNKLKTFKFSENINKSITNIDYNLGTKKQKKNSENTKIQKIETEYSDKFPNHLLKKEYIKEQYCNINNIIFEDGYYQIIITSNGQPTKSIAPLIIHDNESFNSYNIIKKYFEERFPQNIKIRYNSSKVIDINNKLMISAYIRILQTNIQYKGDWTDEINNSIRPSLKKCKKLDNAQIYKEIIHHRNEYMDYLIGHQSERRLIKIYEVTLFGATEDCYIFFISINNQEEIIIFENINFARATELFICKKENYEIVVQKIFDYFTTNQIEKRRQMLNEHLVNPTSFFAESYQSITHKKLQTWINHITNYLEKDAKHLIFKSGFNPYITNGDRKLTRSEISTKNIHESIKYKLYNILINKYGKENVGTEIHIGSKRIDLVVKDYNVYDIYEIKTAQDPRVCIVQAMGQILDYSYFECTDNIRDKIIVGPTPITEEVNTYIKRLQKEHNLQLSYISVE